MLAHVLALAVAIGSIAIYLAAFFFPSIHRKNDFIWSGVGLFYGLVLWVFARRITGGLLLGHVASVALLGWFGWQTISLRRQVVLQAQQTPISTSAEVQANMKEQVTKVSIGERIGGFTSSLGGIFAGIKSRSATNQTNADDSTILNKAIIDVIATAGEESTSEEEVTATETVEQATTTETETETGEQTATTEIETEEQATTTEAETETGEQKTDVETVEQNTDVATTDVEATEIEAKTENETEPTPVTPPSPESEPVEELETEEQIPPATAEATSDGEPAPPIETPKEQKPPDTPSEG